MFLRGCEFPFSTVTEYHRRSLRGPARTLQDEVIDRYQRGAKFVASQNETPGFCCGIHESKRSGVERERKVHQQEPNDVSQHTPKAPRGTLFPCLVIHSALPFCLVLLKGWWFHRLSRLEDAAHLTGQCRWKVRLNERPVGGHELSPLL